MSISESIEGKKRIQESLLEFLEEESNVEENYENFVKVINTYKIQEDKYELKSIIQMINKISDNHQRTFNFIERIERILILLKRSVNKYFTNSEKFKFLRETNDFFYF